MKNKRTEAKSAVMRKVRRINHCKMIALLPRFVKENNINVGDRLFVAYEGDRLMVVKLPQKEDK